MQEQAQQYAIGWGTLSLINAGLAQSNTHARWFCPISREEIASIL